MKIKKKVNMKVLKKNKQPKMKVSYDGIEVIVMQNNI